jgi:hypothetical protein
VSERLNKCRKIWIRQSGTRCPDLKFLGKFNFDLSLDSRRWRDVWFRLKFLLKQIFLKHDILVVQDRMAKLIFKCVVVEKVLYSFCDDRLLQYLVDVDPSAHVDHNELADKRLNFS